MKATIVVDPMFGDGGKGAAVDYLAGDADLIVRFSGGAQASHAIQDERGPYHAGLLGSGLLRGIPVFLSEYVRVDPIAIRRDLEALKHSPLSYLKPQVFLDPKALLVTPYHVEASQKAAPASVKGTTGMGVGESARSAKRHPETAVYADDLTDRTKLVQKLWGQMWDYRSQYSPEDIADTLIGVDNIFLQSWEQMSSRYKNVIFEGSGGFYIDPVFGYSPYVTSTRTTQQRAVLMIHNTGVDASYKTVGVLPIFTTRHGPGPFPTEQPSLRNFLIPYQGPATPGQGPVRVGWLDLDLAVYACEIMHLDSLHVSHLDLWDAIPFWRVKTSNGLVEVDSPQELLDMIEQETGIPISVVAYGPKRSDRKPYDSQRV